MATDASQLRDVKLDKKKGGEQKPEKAEAKAQQNGSATKAEEEKKEGRKADDPMRVLARRAVEIAEAGGAPLGSAITAPQAEQMKGILGDEPMKHFGAATLQQMQDYAQGGRGNGRSDLPEEARTKLRELCNAAESRRVWPRKMAALILALEEQRTGRARPGTKVKESAAAAHS